MEMSNTAESSSETGVSRPRASAGSTRLRQEFAKNGFVVLRNVLGEAQVDALRSELTRIFDAPSTYPGDINEHTNYKRAYFDPLNRYASLTGLPFQPALVAALRELLGDDFLFLPEAAIHDRGYGGWHKDTTSQEVAGLRFHREADFRIVQCALYLQENHPLYGGGIDVIVGSHRNRDRIVPQSKVWPISLVSRALYKLKSLDDNRRGRTVSTAAGDVVIFDYRLDHRATPARVSTIPEAHRKFAFFIVASANDRHARAYRRYIQSRPDYVYLKGYETSPALAAEAKHASVGLLD